MSTNTLLPIGLPGFHDPGTGLQRFNAEQFSRTSASREQSTNLSITTAQGDTITLSLNALTETARNTYDRFGRTANEQIQIHEESLSVEDKRAFSIQVEGDLNQRELKDLQKVIKQVDRIVGDLLKGDLDHAVQRASKLGNLKSIASLDANIAVRQSVTVEQQRFVEQQFAATSGTEASPRDSRIPTNFGLPQGIQPEDLLNPETPVRPAQENVNIPDDLEATAGRITRLIDRLHNEVAESGIEPKTLLPHLDDAFSDLFRGLSNTHGKESPILALTKQLQNELIDALKDEREPDNQEMPAP